MEFVARTAGLDPGTPLESLSGGVTGSVLANDKMIEALNVAIQVNANAALVCSARTLDAFKAKVS